MRESSSPIGDADDGVPVRLDDARVLEPVDDTSSPLLKDDPVVRDVRGRLWRVRWRPRLGDPAGWALVAAAILLAALVAVWLAS